MRRSTTALGLLRQYLAPLRWRVALLAALLVGATAAQLVGPQLLRTFIDGATGTAATSTLVRLAGAFVLATAVTQVLTVAAAYLSEQVGWSATNALRTDLFRHALGLDLPFHHAHSPGRLIERIDGDVTALSTFFTQFVLRVVGGLLLLTGVLVLITIEEPRIGVPLALFLAATFALLSRARSFAVPSVNAERESSAEVYGFIEERLTALEDLRANGGGDYVLRRFYGVTRQFLFNARRAAQMTATVWSLATLLFAGAYVLVLALSALLYQRGELTIGAVYLFFQYTQVMRRPLEQLADQLKELQRAAASIRRVGELFAFAPELEDGSRAPAVRGAAAVEFRDVDFAYDPSEPVLAGVSLRLEPGRVLGVIGRTGGGKTTLGRLLLRFYDPTAGAVLLDGLDLRAWQQEALRRRVGVVTQEVELISGTIRDNLTLFDASVSEARIESALATLGLEEWLTSMPAGLDTALAAGGSGLSAGEAQLLAFARVFLRDPGLVILDEASSRLDPATEALIERAVGRLLEGRTGIVIAHRLHTVERAHEIAVIDRGLIVEHGEREALGADQGSRYAALLRTALERVPS